METDDATATRINIMWTFFSSINVLIEGNKYAGLAKQLVKKIL